VPHLTDAARRSALTSSARDAEQGGQFGVACFPKGLLEAFPPNAGQSGGLRHAHGAGDMAKGLLDEGLVAFLKGSRKIGGAACGVCQVILNVEFLLFEGYFKAPSGDQATALATMSGCWPITRI
jgi:hypothetical protein